MPTTKPYSLHLLASLKSEAEKVAAAEGTTLDQFINVAVAEKLAALRTSRYFQDRAAGASRAIRRGIAKIPHLRGYEHEPDIKVAIYRV